MKTRTITEYDEVDVLEKAMTIIDVGTVCPGGEFCPNCRLALAVAQLTEECELHFYYGDLMLRVLKARGVKKGIWLKEEGDKYLQEQLKKWKNSKNNLQLI